MLDCLSGRNGYHTKLIQLETPLTQRRSNPNVELVSPVLKLCQVYVYVGDKQDRLSNNGRLNDSKRGFKMRPPCVGPLLVRCVLL